MNALVIYDSNYGNTKLVADAIAAAFGARAVAVDDVKPEMLDGLDLLVVGSPINAWRPTPKMNNFLRRLTPGQLPGCRAAAFDTRVRLFIHGNAAKIIAADLQRAGATLAAEPEGFLVQGKEGPLMDGELERAGKWAKEIANHEHIT